MLRVIISLSLVWKKQFYAMIGKLKDAVRKLNNTEIITPTESMHYNSYLIKKAHCSCGTFTILQREEEMLKKTCEPVMLQKLGVSTKFPCDVPYARKLAVGFVLIAPSAIVNVLALRLYVSHYQGESTLVNWYKC